MALRLDFVTLDKTMTCVPKWPYGASCNSMQKTNGASDSGHLVSARGTLL